MALSGLLPGVVFHDELFFELDRDLVAERELHERAFHLASVNSHVFRGSRSVSNGFLDLHVFLRAFANCNHVTGLDLARRRVAADTVHGEVTVSDILASCKNRASKTHAVDKGVKTGFEQDHQVVTSRTGATVGFVISLGQLSFGNVVGETQTLLFDELLLVHGRRLLAGLAMLAGCKVTAIESLLSLLRDGESERTGYLTFWSTERG